MPPSPHRSTGLPARPWVRDDVPLVWRTDTCVEVGWPPRQARIEDVDADHVAWLLGLRGQVGLDDALAGGAARGLRPAAMRRLLRAGVSSGLVDDAAAMPESLRDLPVRARDLLAADLASARHLHGGTAGARAIIDRRRSAEVSVQGTGPVADVIAMVLTSAGIGSIVSDRPAHSSSRRHRRSTVDRACHVLCDSSHPDASSDSDAMALDIPHLAVCAAGTRGVIGPLVIPGRTSCLRCRDLHLADADPTWPRAAVQWASRRPTDVPAGLAHLSGAWAALQVLAVVDAGPASVSVPTMGGAIVVSLPDATVDLEPRPAHPLCGCLWPETGRGTARQPA